MKGIVGDVLMATLRNNQGSLDKGNNKRGESSDEESEKAENWIDWFCWTNFDVLLS